MTPARLLRLKFARSLRRGFVDNASVDPSLSSGVREVVEFGEEFPVVITSKNGTHYWLSDRRLLSENDGAIDTLFRYSEIQQVHWIAKDFLRNALLAEDPERQVSNMKVEHGDRLFIELQSGRLVCLDGLKQSYFPLFEFLTTERVAMSGDKSHYHQ